MVNWTQNLWPARCSALVNVPFGMLAHAISSETGWIVNMAHGSIANAARTANAASAASAVGPVNLLGGCSDDHVPAVRTAK